MGHHINISLPLLVIYVALWSQFCWNVLRVSGSVDFRGHDCCGYGPLLPNPVLDSPVSASPHLYVCFGFVEQAQGGVAVAVGSQRYEGLQPLQTQPQVGSSAGQTRQTEGLGTCRTGRGRGVHSKQCVGNDSVGEVCGGVVSSLFGDFHQYSWLTNQLVSFAVCCTEAHVPMYR